MKVLYIEIESCSVCPYCETLHLDEFICSKEQNIYRDFVIQDKEQILDICPLEEKEKMLIEPRGHLPGLSDQYLEGDKDWMETNREAVIYLLERELKIQRNRGE